MGHKSHFFHDCGLYFWRFFRLFLLSIPLYLAVLGIFYSLIKAFLKIFNRRAPTEWLALIVRNLRILALVLLFFLWQQLYIFFRQGSRLLFYASTLELMRQYHEPVEN